MQKINEKVEYGWLQISDLHIFDNTEWKVMEDAYNNLEYKKYVKFIGFRKKGIPDKMKIAFLTLGCKVNSYETEKMKMQFETEGHQIVSFSEKADVYVVNTCTVTNIADRKSRKMLHRARRMNPDAVVAAAGCYVDSARRKGEEDESVDLFIGNEDKENMVLLVEKLLEEKGVFQTEKCPEHSMGEMSEKAENRLLPAPGTYREEDIIPLRSAKHIAMEDGFVFRLGEGHEVEVIHMPGHAAGGCMLLDRKYNLLFSGDAVVFTPTLIIGKFPAPYYPEYLNVTAFRDALKKALPKCQNAKKLYAGHSVQGISPVYLTDMMDCCEKIIAHPDQYETYDYVSDPSQKQIMCVGHAMIVYTNDRI